MFRSLQRGVDISEQCVAAPSVGDASGTLVSPVGQSREQHLPTMAARGYGHLAPDYQRLELRKMSGFIGHKQGTRAAEVLER